LPLPTVAIVAPVQLSSIGCVTDAEAFANDHELPLKVGVKRRLTKLLLRFAPPGSVFTTT
jgi:hypothetical protein